MDSNHTEADSTQPEGEGAKGGATRAVVSMVGACLILAVGGVSYWAYQGQQQASVLADDLARMEAKLGGVTSQLKGIEQTQGDYKSQLENKVQALDDSVLQQGNRLNQMGGEQNWKLHEARYLLVLAIERLAAFDDVATAKRLVRSADDRVQQMGQPNTLKLRQSIARDIAKLNAVEVPDLQGTWVRLGALAEQLDSLTFFNLEDPSKRPEMNGEQASEQTANANESQAEAASGDATQEPAWKRSLKGSWQELKGLVKVREYNPESFSLVLTSQEQGQLLAMLHMLTEQARWAATHKDLTIYQGSLDALKSWVERYFVEDSTKQAVLTEIEALKATPIQFEAPQLSSIEALDSYMQSQGEKLHTSPIPKPAQNANLETTTPMVREEPKMEPDPLAQEAWPPSESDMPLDEATQSPQQDEQAQELEND